MLSSVFDVLTFVALLRIFHAATGDVPHRLVRRVAADGAGRRARRADPPPVLQEPAGHAAARVDGISHRVALVIPYLPFTHVLGFVPLPGALLAVITLITMLYVVATELQKRWFYRRRSAPMRGEAR